MSSRISVKTLKSLKAIRYACANEKCKRYGVDDIVICVKCKKPLDALDMDYTNLKNVLAQTKAVQVFKAREEYAESVLADAAEFELEEDKQKPARGAVSRIFAKR